MNRNFISCSLETHLFFGRIMKEHALFLMSGFLCKDKVYTERADWYRGQFEELLREAVSLGAGNVKEEVLCSGELVTDFTLQAEEKTTFLTGIPIDGGITKEEKMLGKRECGPRELLGAVRKLNRKALRLTAGFIDLKRKIIRDLSGCRLFAFHYRLLVEHLLREASLYRSLIMELERTGTWSGNFRMRQENFWNQIMMEHAQFIRGLLDPTEEELIHTADGFASDYRALLEEAKQRDCEAAEELKKRSLEETLKYREFKTAGTKGILECRISGLILPLLADHVLREANHYLRLLQSEN